MPTPSLSILLPSTKTPTSSRTRCSKVKSRHMARFTIPTLNLLSGLISKWCTTPSSRHTNFPSTGRPRLPNAGAPPVPTLRLNFLLKTNSITSVPSPLGHLLPTHLRFRMAIALALLLMVPPVVQLPLMMAFIRIVGLIIARRHNHLLINLLRAIGVSRRFNPHMHVPMLPVRPRQSIRRGAVPGNALPAYRVPQTARLDRPTTILAIIVLLVAHVVETAHRHNSRRIHPRPLLAVTVAMSLPVQLPANRPCVPITGTPPPPLPRPLQPLALLSPVHRYYMHRRHVQQGLRHCHKAVQQRRSACHVMTAN